MKIFITISLLLLTAVSVSAQQLHFAYLQTDAHKPFYVVLNKKNYSSTASGYIILPKLQNGDYPVRIGFAKNENAEQEYLLQVKDNDQGLLIKDFGDKGWGLFNMQTMAVQYAGTAAQEKAKLATAEKAEADLRQKKLDEELLAANTQRRNDSIKAAGIAQQHYNDSVAAIATANNIRQRNDADSIAKATAAVQQTIHSDSVNNANTMAAENERLERIADSTATAQAALREKLKETNIVVVKPEKKKQKATPPDEVVHPADTNMYNQPAPLLLQQTFTDSGWQYTYTITNNNQRERVNVFIPAHQPMQPVVSSVAEVQKDTVVAAIQTPVDTVKTLPVKVNTDTVAAIKNTLPDTIKNNVMVAGNVPTQQNTNMDSLVQVIEKPILNSNCKALANEADFLSARKKIASAVGTDNMLLAARKVFKQKCFTTEQLRNLSVLFLTDAGRYQFMDAAYPFAFDAYRYNTLQDLLLDDYYIQRFKAMLH